MTPRQVLRTKGTLLHKPGRRSPQRGRLRRENIKLVDTNRLTPAGPYGRNTSSHTI